MNPRTGEVVRMVASMTGACAIGAAVLGLVYMGTERYRVASGLRMERMAIRQMLELDERAALLEVRQYLDGARGEVVYRATPLDEAEAGGAAGSAAGDATSGEAGIATSGDAGPAAGATSGVVATREVSFTLDGQPAARPAGAGAAGAPPEELEPLGRVIVATRDGALAGFVLDDEVRGYKNRIRFLVALKPDFRIAGVRVIEHEEDPGLGAEIATGWFQGQFTGRSADQVARLSVTRDPMPEDWRNALVDFARGRPDGPARQAALLERERTRPIYAVTGATISSEALTVGVRASVDHFRRRWALLAPHFGGTR
jgi:electron transport complex protein RnfG